MPPPWMSKTPATQGAVSAPPSTEQPAKLARGIDTGTHFTFCGGVVTLGALPGRYPAPTLSAQTGLYDA